MEKRCGACKETLPITEFRIDPKTRVGLTSWCVKCSNKATAASQLKLRLETVAHLGGNCRKCGYSADHRALAIDHVNGGGVAARRSGVRGARLLRAAIADTEDEYQLLCFNCNTIKRVAEDEHGDRVYTRKLPSQLLPPKRCSRCDTVKASLEFHRNAGRHDGLSVYCSPCLRAFNQEHHRTMRLKAIEHLGGECLHCGYLDDDRALVFDHVEGGGLAERKSGVVGVGTFRAVLVDTVDRYQLLCANCNQIKKVDKGEGIGKRKYQRTVPTEMIDRPNQRWTPEARAVQSEKTRKMWEDPEHRATQSALRSVEMQARWDSGEIPCRRKPLAG